MNFPQSKHSVNEVAPRAGLETRFRSQCVAFIFTRGNLVKRQQEAKKLFSFRDENKLPKKTFWHWFKLTLQVYEQYQKNILDEAQRVISKGLLTLQ